MTEKTESKIKILREKRGKIPKELTEMIKSGNKIKSAIKKALVDGPKTVPEISEATGLDSQSVLWHVIAMKKYASVAEAGQNGDYWNYELVEEKK